MFGRLTGTQNVDANEAYRMAQEGAVLVDVREPFEYANGHAPGATLIPLGQLEREFGKLPRDKRIVTVCASGNRSTTAAQFLAQRGYDVTNLAGGMLAWQGAGLPVRHGNH